MAYAYRLTVEYEGTRYRGFQEQKNARTVGGELRAAIEGAIGERVELGGAGRTDAGVHALAQEAHLKLEVPLVPERFVPAVNDRLPPDIQLLSCVAASPRFHARHDARSRSYVYQISLRRTALAKRFVWWIRRPLDVERMSAAAGSLVGRHDFARFSEKAEEQSSTIVVVEAVEVVREGELVLVRVAASHFLWKMVRRLVGTLVAIGAGEIDADELARLLDPRAQPGFLPAAHTAPPSGLFLERVIYDGDPALGVLRAPVPVAAAQINSSWAGASSSSAESSTRSSQRSFSSGASATNDRPRRASSKRNRSSTAR